MNELLIAISLWCGNIFDGHHVDLRATRFHSDVQACRQQLTNCLLTPGKGVDKEKHKLLCFSQTEFKR